MGIESKVNLLRQTRHKELWTRYVTEVDRGWTEVDVVQKWTETVPCRSTSDPLLVQPRRVGELGGPRWTTPPQQVRGHPNKLGPPQQVGGHPNTLGLPQLVGVHVSALTADPRRPRWSKPRLPEPWADACDVSTAQYSVVMPALTAFNDGACVHRKVR